MGLCLGKQTEGGDSEENVKFSGGNVHLITSKESWDQKLVESSGDGKIVIANFSATWCGPCKTMAPFYHELSEKYPSVVFLLIDVEELTVTIRPTAKLYQLTNMPNKSVIRKELSTSWEVKATPTFFILRDGQQVDKHVGANKSELEKRITAIVDSTTQRQN